MDSYFQKFSSSVKNIKLPEKFTFPFYYEPHPLCKLAANEVQNYLLDQKDFNHNFGLKPNKKGLVLGKMFGILIVLDNKGEIGYLTAVSGKMAGKNLHKIFVPPVYDMLKKDSPFLNEEKILNKINTNIEKLEKDSTYVALKVKLASEKTKASIDISKHKEHRKNTNTEKITMTLPSLTVNMNRIFPFAGKGGVQKTPIQKMGFNYTMQGQYLINTTDDEFFTSKMFQTARSGAQHKTGTNTNIKAFKYFTLSPSVNYEETWQFDYIQKKYDITENIVVTDTLRGFKSYREYNAGVSLSTNIYGTFNFKKGRLKTIRHTFRPSISYSYRPDFKDKYLQQVQQSADATDLLDYTVFDQGIYGAPSSGLSNSIGISLNNVLEAKVASKDPESDEEDEKVTILNNRVPAEKFTGDHRKLSAAIL